MNYRGDIKKVRALVLDVDGVLTDGRIGYGCGSDDEIKFFDVKDGAAMSIIRDLLGYKIIIISGRKSKANQRRARELNVTLLVEDTLKKAVALRQACEQLGLTPEECLYIGDDFVDIPAMELACVTASPGDAEPIVRERAHWQLEHNGGRGAIREAVLRLLREQGIWESTLEKGLRERWN
ncbi:MAG: HAD-IIIA family hydrolase [Victivallales bacterium]|nr:HAD-IIIA family hydrolase [Victivallales bacterium]